MKRPVLWSEDALRELDAALAYAALAYIAARDHAAARRMLVDLRAAGDQLGVMATGRPGRVPGTHEKTVSRRPYVIAYAIDALPGGEERIVILRVIHTARRWPSGRWPE